VTDTQLPAKVKTFDITAVPASAIPLGQVEAYSCRNKAWDAPASEENAIAQLRMMVLERGGNAMTNVHCDPNMGVTPFGRNCWSSYRCTASAAKIAG
jgi:hypothetical protein